MRIAIVADVAAVAAVGAGAILFLRFYGALAEENRVLQAEVHRLAEAQSGETKAGAWSTYRDLSRGFELRYPPQLFAQRQPEASAVSSRNGLAGVRLSQGESGCALEVYVGPSETADPFEESGVDPKLKRYAASGRLGFGGVVYHVGMSVVSHAVDPQPCAAFLEQVLPTFRIVPVSASESYAKVLDRQVGLAPYEVAALQARGFSDPVAAVGVGFERQDLMGRGLGRLPGLPGGALIGTGRPRPARRGRGR